MRSQFTARPLGAPRNVQRAANLEQNARRERACWNHRVLDGVQDAVNSPTCLIQNGVLEQQSQRLL